MAPKLKPVAERIEAGSMPEPNSGCWLWLRYVSRFGYGQLGVVGVGRYRPRLAHRASYETFVGPIPDGLQVLHKCDTPCCVNPMHLFLGTHLDNMADMRAKRRNPKPRGEASSLAKLSAAQAAEIRATAGLRKPVADRYGISESHVSRIRAGKHWDTTNEARGKE